MLDLFGQEKEVEVRALNWKQPYAELMFHGKIETRTWNTDYRGLVLICASKAPYHRDEILKISGNNQLARMEHIIQRPINYKINLMYPGHAVGIGELVDCRPMTKEDEDDCFVQYIEPWVENKVIPNTLFRKFTKKQLWCHIYKNVRRITPFPWKGSQGWKTLDTETKRKVGLI